MQRIVGQTSYSFIFDEWLSCIIVIIWPLPKYSTSFLLNPADFHKFCSFETPRTIYDPKCSNFSTRAACCVARKVSWSHLPFVLMTVDQNFIWHKCLIIFTGFSALATELSSSRQALHALKLGSATARLKTANLRKKSIPPEWFCKTKHPTFKMFEIRCLNVKKRQTEKMFNWALYGPIFRRGHKLFLFFLVLIWRKPDCLAVSSLQFLATVSHAYCC